MFIFKTYYKIRQCVITIHDSSAYYKLRQRVITIYNSLAINYNSRRQLLQFTIGVTIHDQCYLRQVLQFTTEHTYPSSWRVCIGNYFQLQYAVSIPEKNLDLPKQVPRGIDGRLLYPAGSVYINFFCSVSEVRGSTSRSAAHIAKM